MPSTDLHLLRTEVEIISAKPTPSTKDIAFLAEALLIFCDSLIDEFDQTTVEQISGLLDRFGK